ncbi:MAG: hypothetical protein ACI9K5_002525, partial [Gammaproteobacteria bacterium]
KWRRLGKCWTAGQRTDREVEKACGVADLVRQIRALEIDGLQKIA